MSLLHELEMIDPIGSSRALSAGGAGANVGGDLVSDSAGFRVAFLFQLVGKLLQLGPAGHHARQLGQADVRLVEVTEALATFEEEETISNRVRVVWGVGDEDDAEALISRLKNVLENDPGLFDTEGRGRLVENQQPRPEMHGASDSHA